MGKHSKKSNTAATFAASTAIVGVAAGVLAPTASAAPDSDWDRLAQCESGGNWAANTGNGFYGGLQFHPQTWTGFGGGEFAATADRASREQQIYVAEKVLAAQGWNAWPACSRKLGLNSPATPRDYPGQPAPAAAATPGTAAADRSAPAGQPELPAELAAATPAVRALYDTLLAGFAEQGRPVPPELAGILGRDGADFDAFYAAVAPYLDQVIGR